MIMHTGKRYGVRSFFVWTFRHTFWILIWVSIPTLLYFLGLKILHLPWQPIAILGTAAAFIIGFKNNASYGRIWEARQIYGAVINDSRSFGYTLLYAIGNKQDPIVVAMFNRHFAWLTALRYQLREPRNWENMNNKNNVRYKNTYYSIPEEQLPIEEALKEYLTQDELQYILSKKNRATQLSSLQSRDLAQLKEGGIIDNFQWMQLQGQLTKFTDDQGKAERIKNFPYPRNFASITTYLLFIFIALLPFGMIQELDQLGTGTAFEGWTIWLNIPFSAILAWAFFSLDIVGESAMNPFEGGANDIPITQISRAIEIDMLDMLDQTNLPEGITAKNEILM